MAARLDAWAEAALNKAEAGSLAIIFVGFRQRRRVDKFELDVTSVTTVREKSEFPTVAQSGGSDFHTFKFISYCSCQL